MKIILLSLVCISVSCSRGRFDTSNLKVLDSSEFNPNSGWVKLEDNQQISPYTRIGNQIFCGEIACKNHPMQDVDANSFYVWPATEYAKDQNHVYFPESFTCVEDYECSACYNSNCIIENADPKTFECISIDSAKDNSAIYSRSFRAPN